MKMNSQNPTAEMSEMTFQLSADGRPTDAQALYAYLVNNVGDTIESQSIGEKGVFKFKTGMRALHSSRILIAPELPDKTRKPTLDDLRDFSAYEPMVKVDPKLKVQHISPVPAELWPKWPLCFCRIRGRVEKDFCLWLKDPFCFQPFQQYCPPHPYCFTLPVCPARVHICRLKPRFILTLPDVDVLRIRADLLRPILVVPPFPPDPIGPIAEVANAEETMLTHEEAPVSNGMVMKVSVSSPAGSLKAATTGKPASQMLSAALQFKLQSESPDLLRQALAEHIDEIKQLVPYFDWCSLLYTCQEIRVVDVDDHGHFEAWWLHDCHETADLYFWVEYLYNANWVTVYRPAMCAGTHWNFDCSNEVVINVTDNRVTGCRPITGRFLEVTRVGTNAWLPLIDTTTGFAAGIDFGDSTVDAAGNTINSGSFERPFGGTLVINGNFGFNLPDPALATHYRVSYKLSSLPDVDANWNLINTPLSRTYNDTIDIGGGASKLVTSAFELKDPTFPDFYRIPKENADQQTEIPHGADLQDRRWASDEFAIAVLDTEGRALAEGTYDLRIQLCRAPAPGASPLPVAVPREVFEMPDPANFNQSKFCDDAHLILSGANALAFRMRLKVDRAHCSSSIGDASVDGGGSDPQCGILHRGTNAGLSFVASHPRDRATFGFGVVRGNGNNVGADTAGLVGAATAEHGYTRSGTQFAATVPVSQLFASSGCPSAAFAETLNVAAMATDGSYRLNGYDAPERHAAFAIITP
jgi:hypothetical protein